MVNFSAIFTIVKFRIHEFFSEYHYSILGPLISNLLFVIIFSTIDRYYNFNSLESSYINFLIPGMIMSIIIQTSFNHLSEVIINMKQIGSFNDFLISPISRIEIFISFILSSIFVCIIVAFLNFIVLSFFVEYESINFIIFIYYLILSITVFSSIGAIIGFLSFSWDIQSSVSNFFILPVSFFSGTFFSIDLVDKKYQFIFYYNPFYYLVNGFRSAFINSYEISFYNNIYIFIIAVITLIISIYIFQKGYKVIN